MSFTKCDLAYSPQNIHTVSTGRIHKSYIRNIDLSDMAKPRQEDWEKYANKHKADLLGPHEACLRGDAEAQRK